MTEEKEEETIFFTENRFFREHMLKVPMESFDVVVVDKKKFFNGRRPTTIKKDVCQKITTVAEPCF